MSHWKCKTRPTTIFVKKIQKHIKETGQPETMPDIFHDKILKTERYEILGDITVPRGKRPNGDKAPCPMCVPDKFYEGRICWFMDLECVAVIGHCCADKETAYEAEQNYRRKKQRDSDQGYLLENLPLISKKLNAVQIARPAAEDAQRLFRLFKRKDAKEVHDGLRAISKTNGQLVITEVFKQVATGGGPAGFGRHAGGLDSRDHSFGYLTGLIAANSRYDPVGELDEVERRLLPDKAVQNEEEALEVIVTMDEKEQRFSAESLREADKAWRKFSERLSEFRSFFSESNLMRLKRWGEAPGNDHPIIVSFKYPKGKWVVYLQQGLSEVRLSPGEALLQFSDDWPSSS